MNMVMDMHGYSLCVEPVPLVVSNANHVRHTNSDWFNLVKEYIPLQKSEARQKSHTPRVQTVTEQSEKHITVGEHY